METEAKIPKQDLLAKLLKMSTSPNDGEALTAIRKANELLRNSGWDWDKLIAGKIKVAADPFANLAQPYNPASGNGARPPVPPRPQAPPHPPPRPQPPPPPRPAPPPPKPFEPRSHQTTNGQTNIYAGHCYCCGAHTDAGDGKLFVPNHFNHAATGGKKVICNACDSNRHAFVDRKPAVRRGPVPFSGPAPTANDL